MLDEEESKKLRIFQRYERQELQLIIERCNEVVFDYVCLPSIRSDKDLCFGSKTPRKINFYIGDKTVNSYERRCLKESFPEPNKPVKSANIQDEETPVEVTEVKLSYPFSSKVQRFQDITIDSSGIYRRKKKTREPVVQKKVHSSFGSSSKRKFLITRNHINSSSPGIGTYNINKEKTYFFKHSFNGDVTIEPAFQIVCSPINLDNKCEMCEETTRNVYWKSRSTQTVLCRSCYNRNVLEIHEKTKGIVEKFRQLKQVEKDFEKKRYCDFYHEHNKTLAAIRLLPPKVFQKRVQKENFLNTLFHY